MNTIKLWNRDPFIDFFEPFFDVPPIKKNTNISDNETDYRIEMSVPGLSKEDIKIGIKNGIISISYENNKTDGKTYSFTSSFQKSYTLPDDIDEQSVSGKVENGVLEIIIPKTEKKSLERFIPIG